MEPSYLQEDLKQECILIICELPEDKLLRIYNDGVLEFYTIRIILNQIKSNTSPFFKMYRRIYYELDNNNIIDNLNTEDAELVELKEWMAANEVNKLPFYNKTLIDLYLKFGTYRAIQKETGISFNTCYKSIKKSFNTIKKSIVNCVNDESDIYYNRLLIPIQAKNKCA